MLVVCVLKFGLENQLGNLIWRYTEETGRLQNSLRRKHRVGELYNICVVDLYLPVVSVSAIWHACS